MARLYIVRKSFYLALLVSFLLIQTASAGQCSDFYSPSFRMLASSANIYGTDFSYRKLTASKSNFRLSDIPELKDKLLVQITTSGHIRLIYNSIRFDTSGRPANLNLFFPMRTNVKNISSLEDGVVFIINDPPIDLQSRIDRLIKEYPGHAAYTCATGACRAFISLTDNEFIKRKYLAPTTVLEKLLWHSFEHQNVSVLSIGEDLNDVVRMAQNKMAYWRTNGVLGGASELAIAGVSIFGLYAVFPLLKIK